MLPLQDPLLHTPPRHNVRHREHVTTVPCRSDRLAAKAAFRDTNPERQAKRVLINKWEHRPEQSNETSDVMIAAKFHDTFAEPISSSKREALRELFPLRRTRRAGGNELAC